MKMSAEVMYIYHSGFAVKTANYLLVFDYFKDGPHCNEAALIHEMQDREVVVFSSHSHGDHFNPAILGWKDRTANVHYVLSDDIRQARSQDNVTHVQAGQKHHIQGLDIEVLGSTDLGVSFLVSCDGITIFHAGDLNWWHWEGEPEDDNKAMAESYKQEIDLLKGKQIDLAFIPVDPRLEAQYHWGLSYFLSTVGARRVFPMHFGEDYSIFKRLRTDLPTEELKCIVDISPSSWQFTYSRPAT